MDGICVPSSCRQRRLGCTAFPGELERGAQIEEGSECVIGSYEDGGMEAFLVVGVGKKRVGRRERSICGLLYGGLGSVWLEVVSITAPFCSFFGLLTSQLYSPPLEREDISLYRY